MSQPSNHSNRRPGPVGFSAESKVTSLRTPRPANPGGIGEASGPTRETPRKSKELRVAGPLIWASVGIVTVVFGIIILTLAVVLIGVAICLGAVFVNRRNRTEMRLRSDFDDPEKS